MKRLAPTLYIVQHLAGPMCETKLTTRDYHDARSYAETMAAHAPPADLYRFVERTPEGGSRLLETFRPPYAKQEGAA